ncbi:hypothetical protein NOR_08381 [Metarhizium rileyi]|uniref:Uncharacterized protein n=1 Tax=Metarhizium rileyi (strain RCEF 4871) TaxID=1649241 RepID=A0A166WDW9_METRR|nr:hypothetical protein NOR_08381 [Metarhizium rileyi RCEF 4871]TWU71392.1 hypothetical protein ED733_002522 [Metarhizium rileyi]
MKFILATVTALASLAVAAPGSGQCKPATYRCEPHRAAWDVCNTSGEWVFAGNCPPDTVCKFNPKNGSPYCLPWDF